MKRENDNFDSDTFPRLAQICNGYPTGPRDFLLDEDYLECVNSNIPTDKLTEKGKKAKDLGGHLKYKEWETEEKRKKRIEDFPKRRWWIYEPLKAIAILILTNGLTAFATYMIIKSKANKPPPTTQSLTPTDTAQHYPKTLDKKDSAK